MVHAMGWRHIVKVVRRQVLQPAYIRWIEIHGTEDAGTQSGPIVGASRAI